MATNDAGRGLFGFRAATGSLAVCACLLAVQFFGIPAVHADAVPSSDALKLQLEVDALSTMEDLHLTPAQLSALQDLSSDTAAALPTSGPNLDGVHYAALQALRAALISGNEDQISQAQDKVSDLEEQQEGDDDTDVEPTDAAKGKVTAAVKLLTARQLAGYISENTDDIPDPGEILVGAVKQCQGLSDDDYQSLRDDTTDQLGELAGGLSPSKAPSIIARAGRFLDHAHHLSADDFKTQLPTLEDEARKLGNSVDPMACLRHWFEGEMADLLSNPQLGQALTDRGVPASQPAGQ
jgi:hypothetical protein